MPANSWRRWMLSGLLCSVATWSDSKPPASPPDAELLEFLGGFETAKGQWPELNDMLTKKIPATLPPPRRPKEEAK